MSTTILAVIPLTMQEMRDVNEDSDLLDELLVEFARVGDCDPVSYS